MTTRIEKGQSEDQRDVSPAGPAGVAGAAVSLGPDELLRRMHAGDREAAAAFIQQYGGMIRRRMRHKLSPSMRRLFDSMEMLSTIARRLDRVVYSRQIGAESLNELWSLVFRIAEHSLTDKVRIYQRLSRVEKQDGPLANELLARMRLRDEREDAGAELELDRVLSSVGSSTDRHIAALWLRGVPHAVIAEYVDMTPAGVRKRWQRIREEMRTQLQEDTR